MILTACCDAPVAGVSNVGNNNGNGNVGVANGVGNGNFLVGTCIS